MCASERALKIYEFTLYIIMHNDIQKVYWKFVGPLFVGAPGQLPTLPSPKSGPDWASKETYHTFRATLTKIHAFKIKNIWTQISFNTPS